jgi:hypothetical protein
MSYGLLYSNAYLSAKIGSMSYALLYSNAYLCAKNSVMQQCVKIFFICLRYT